jgi:hypothetical protein
MSKKIFKFVRDPQTGINCGPSLDQIVSRVQVPESKSDRLVPDGNTLVDVVNDFKWTKTKRGSVGRKGTPTLDLQEFYVTVPAFFSNLNVAKQIATNAGSAITAALEGIVEMTGAPASITKLINDSKELGRKGDKLADEGMAGIRKSFGAEESATSFNGLKYLKAYEHLYGVKRSNFIYKLPYLEDSYKKVSNTWGTGTGALNQGLQGIVDTITKGFSFAAPGVGIDWSKSFEYGTDGPSHTVKFFLDNTKDADYTGEGAEIDEWAGTATRRAIPNYETNFRLVYLLLYQNMPNRLNRLALVPPVIYRAKLPGVFSYRYSFLSSLEVNMIGIRKTKRIPDFITTENNKDINVVIPEGYEITLTLQSLLPETQNLYFDAINNPVFSTEEQS